MPGLTNLGIVHTAISLVAVGAGAVALTRDKEITSRNGVGQLYIWTTVLTCLTGFPIMQHGGFGKPHALGVITLLVLVVAALAGRGKFGRASRYVEVVGYSATFFFHMIPTFTETATRLPVGAPLAASAEAPGLQATIGAVFVIFLIGAALQVCRLRAENRPEPSRTIAPATSNQAR
ncbi:MAG TPA: hypothetical protein VNH84_08325 [Candidatus Saccharimonadales bacterium]|nr:hypothetical protein [Candidatus Saccharimonadales bacterium]